MAHCSDNPQSDDVTGIAWTWSNDPMAPVRHCELQSAQRQASWQRRPKATSLQCETITCLVLILARKEARDVDL